MHAHYFNRSIHTFFFYFLHSFVVNFWLPKLFSMSVEGLSHWELTELFWTHLTHRANNLQTRNKRRKRSRDYYKDRHCGGDKNWGKEIHHRRRAFQTFTRGKDYCSSSQCKKGGFKSFRCVSCLNIFHSYFILIFSCCRR